VRLQQQAIATDRCEAKKIAVERTTIGVEVAAVEQRDRRRD
jgi:hypothetical protein